MHSIEVKRAIILRTHKPDEVLFETTLPSAAPKALGIFDTFATITVDFNKGEEYVKENFPGLPYEVVTVEPNREPI